jgi:hypothetical protein
MEIDCGAEVKFGKGDVVEQFLADGVLLRLYFSPQVSVVGVEELPIVPPQELRLHLRHIRPVLQPLPSARLLLLLLRAFLLLHSLELRPSLLSFLPLLLSFLLLLLLLCPEVLLLNGLIFLTIFLCILRNSRRSF